MRLAGIEKGGYYPYPPLMAEADASWFILLPTGTRGRLLDPCAGEGEIAQWELSDRHALNAQRRGWAASPRWVKTAESMKSI